MFHADPTDHGGSRLVEKQATFRGEENPRSAVTTGFGGRLKKRRTYWLIMTSKFYFVVEANSKKRNRTNRGLKSKAQYKNAG
jgi:hypothetical protein